VILQIVGRAVFAAEIAAKNLAARSGKVKPLRSQRGLSPQPKKNRTAKDAKEDEKGTANGRE
jgi:hypothetical protein